MNNNATSPLNTLLNKLEIGLRRRIPVVHQTESSECGLACLSMICGHYGRHIDLSTLR
ncbi:cysteine peptidase family C39 domain-containing protein, partial [Escherichia coli]